MNYICLKPCTLNGVAYNLGDTIPDTEVLSSRVNSLTRHGIIAKTESEKELVLSGDLKLSDPDWFDTLKICLQIKYNEDDIGVGLSVEELQTAIDILQKNAVDAQDCLEVLDNENLLMFISAVDSRKGVKNSIKTKFASMAANTSDNDTEGEGAGSDSDGKNESEGK